MSNRYKSEAEIEAVVRGFESCQTPKEQFSHQSHVTVGVWYLFHTPLERATESMRDGLFHFLDHYGLGRQKYHETITVFWIRLIRNEIKRVGSDLPLLELTNKVVASLSDSNLPFKYYNREFLLSDEARQSWVEPDLMDLDWEP